MGRRCIPVNLESNTMKNTLYNQLQSVYQGNEPFLFI